MNILITGGAGSLGRRLVFDLLRSGADKIAVYSRDEYKHAKMAEEMPDPRLRFFIGDVRSKERLKQAMWGMNIVIHTAALKRVDAVSYNPGEVTETNIRGTQNVVDAAIEAGVGKVMVISSDKAVNPENIYGASKFMAEQYAIAANAYGYPRGTKISVIRYGNVIDSRGSVLEVFKRYAAEGEPLPITDNGCSRFMLTLRQASGLVQMALDAMEGGETFVPILPRAWIKDVAHVVVPGQEHMIIGLRPGGEKLHESLLTEDETARMDIGLNGFYVVYPHLMPWKERRILKIGYGRDFHYRSDMEPMMTHGEIRALLEAI